MLPRRDLTRRTSAITRTNYDLQRLIGQGVQHAENALPGLDGCREETRGMVGRELFARFYDPSTAPEGTPSTKAEKMADAIHAELDRVPGFGDLQRLTQLDPTASAAAFCNVADALSGVELPEPEDSEPQDGEGSGSAPGALGDEARAAIRSAISGAVRRTQEQEQDLRDAAVSLFGPEGATLGRRNPDAALELRRAMAAKGALAEAIRLLGRFRRSLSTARTRHVGSGQGEPFSVRPARDIRSALPVELLKFADERTRPLAFYRHQQGQTMCYERRARAKQEKGPFSILLDGSGSMVGRWTSACALTLAALLLAHEQKRAVSLAVFNAGVHPIAIDFSDERAMLASLNRVLAVSPSGGTRITEAFQALPELTPAHGADVLLVSDGIDPSLEASVCAGILDELGADLTYIVIGSPSDAMLELTALASTTWRGDAIEASDIHLADAIGSTI